MQVENNSIIFIQLYVEHNIIQLLKRLSLSSGHNVDMAANTLHESDQHGERVDFQSARVTIFIELSGEDAIYFQIAAPIAASIAIPILAWCRHRLLLQFCWGRCTYPRHFLPFSSLHISSRPRMHHVGHDHSVAECSIANPIANSIQGQSHDCELDIRRPVRFLSCKGTGLLFVVA